MGEALRSDVRATVLLSSLFLGLLGCPKRVGSQSELEPSSREKVEEARRQLDSGRPDEALKLAAEVPEQDNLALAELQFSAAEAFFAQRDFTRARTEYRELLARFPLFERADEAKYHLALCQLELKEYRDALQTLAPLYPRLPEERRPLLANQLARAAEGARNFGEAVRWHAESARLARDEASQQASLKRIGELLDGQVPFTAVARLAQEIAPESPAWPVVQFKLAKIFAHLRDQVRLRETLQELLAKAPTSPWAAEARLMLERSERRTVARTDTIGLALPLSGKYKAFGENVLDGIQLALKGSRVRLVTRDTAGDPLQARRAVAELAQDEQVLAIIGPVLTGEAEEAAAEAELQETPIITLSRAEGVTEHGPYVFRNMLTNSAQAKALVDYAMRVRGFKRFAMLYPNIPYGTELMNFFWDGIDEHDGQVRGAESYESDQTTFGAVVKKLVGRANLDQREEYVSQRREILDTIKDPYRQRKALENLRKNVEPIIDFDALFIPDYFKNIGLVTPALAVEDVITNACDRRDIERIAKTTGKDPSQVKTVQLLGANGWNFDELVERGGKFVQCAVFVDGFFVNSDRKETQAFVTDFRKTYSRDPALLEAEGFDTAKIARFLIEQRKPATRAAFREELLLIKDFPGATGPTRFTPEGEADKPLFLLTIDGGVIREVDSEVKS